MTIALSWDGKPQCRMWSLQLVTSVSDHIESLEKGDPEHFINGYHNLDAENRIKFWAEMIIAVIRYESSFSPTCVFHEPPPLGVDSIGLLQLSYEDQANYHLEPLDKEKRSLEDPLVNIRCGLAIFAHWLEKDGTVTETKQKLHRGAARYWSVMREDRGYLEDIRLHTRNSVSL